jgi:formylglycine-generating enzyme required for sulfatase activity
VEQPPVPVAEAVKKEPKPANVWESLTERSIESIGPRKSGTVPRLRAATAGERTAPKKWLMGGGIGVGVLLLALLGMWAGGVFKVKTKDGILVVEVNEPNPDVFVDGEKMTVSWDNGGKKAEIRVKPGTRKVEVRKDGFSVDGKELTFKDGDQEIFTARLLPEKGVAKADAPPPENVPPNTESPKPAVVNSLGMKFRLIPAGKFIMGSSPEEIARCMNLKLAWPPAEQFESEGPAHEVEITQPFYIGIHEVTVGQFRQFVKEMDYKTQAEKEGGSYRHFPNGWCNIDGDTNWRNPGFEQTDDHPVVCVSWNDAVAFCTWLSGKEGRKYRLPSEAEWEYCCRAKTTTRFGCGDDETRLKEFANLGDASLNQQWPDPLSGVAWSRVAWNDRYPFTAPVGHFRANAFGLHDMHANVGEWCADWYDKNYYQNSPKQDPPGPSAGIERVARGGSWVVLPTHSRSTFRYNLPSCSIHTVGFRIVLSVAAAPADAGFVPLFNSKDLTGWVVDSGDKNAWQVKDGELVAMGSEEGMTALRNQGYLLTEREYSDIVLRFQFQQVATKYAWSGVALRAVPHETARNADPTRRPESAWPLHLTVIVGQTDPLAGPFVTGSLWWKVGATPCLAPDILGDLKKAGEWNDMEIEMRGQSLRIAVNGRDVQNVMLNKTRPDANPLPGLSRFSGRIGFLKRVGEVRFRNIEIKEPPPAAASTPSQSVEVLTPAQAARKVGQKVTVEFRVRSTGGNPAAGFPVELYSEEAWHRAGCFFIRFHKSKLKTFQELGIPDVARYFHGKLIRVTGTVTILRFSQGNFPCIQIDEPDQILAPNLPTPQATLPNSITNSIGMKLVLVKPGTFLMGSPADEKERRPDEDQHEVEITRPFYVGVYEVTQEQYERVMGQNPSHFSSTGGGKDKVKGMDTRQFPVENVLWEEAVGFCRRLSELPEEKEKERTYRLPTEAEWEYVCRGGPFFKRSSPPLFGNSLSSTQANFNGNYPYGGAVKGQYLKRPAKVGSYPPNPLGLYDLQGNVWEWCADWYDAEYYKHSPRQDPQGPENGKRRVFHGGSWDFNGGFCRAAFRGHYALGERNVNLGFRVVLAVAAAPADAGFVPLFNGKDKTGWQTHPSLPDNWRVVPGTNGAVLTCSGPTSHLFSQRGDYQDFHLRAEARINDGGNSGLYFRTQFGPGYPKGYEVQINSTHADPIKTGSLYPSFNPKLTKQQRDKLVVTDMLVKPNEWFTLDVIAQGNHIVIKVNGKTTVDFVDENNAFTRGRFALQHHDRRTEVEFRKIEIKELK